MAAGAMAIVVVACGTLYLVLLALKSAGVIWSISAQRRGGREAKALATDWMRSVTVLQPILSGDAQLSAALADMVRALPEARFCWLIDDDDSEARRIVSSLGSAHPSVAIEVQEFDAAPAGVNPKMFKLAAALRGVTTPIAVVLDDDARLSAASLRQLVSELASADLVTALPFYRDACAGIGGRLLAQFVNNNAALTYLAPLPVMAPVSINGMCYAVRSESVSGADALAPVMTQLADDLALARLFRSRGARIVQSTAPVEMETTTPTLGRYRQQMHRWFLFATLLMREQDRATQVLIALLYALPPLLLGGTIVGALLSFAPAAWFVAATVLLARALTLIGFQRTLTGHTRHRPVLSVVSELLQPLHLLHALLDRTIIWRTRTYRVRQNHDFRPV